MALTKIPRGLLDTGIADSSDATAITIDSSENVAIANGALAVGQSTFSGGNVLADFHGSGNAVGASLAFANDHNTDKFYVGLEGNTTGDGFIYQQKDADINFYTNNAFKVKIDNSGRVLIGKTSGAYGLDIDAADFSGDAFRMTRGTSSLYMVQANDSYGVIGMHSNHDLLFRTNATTRMTISAAGNVTFNEDLNVTIQGTHNEGGGLLFIRGTDTAAASKNLGSLCFGNPSDSCLAMIRGVSTDTTASDLRFYTEAQGAAIEERLRITSAGSVGIGIAPESWNSNFKALQIGPWGSLATTTSGNGESFRVNANFYNDGSAEKYLGSGYALMFKEGVTAGSFVFSSSQASGTADASIASWYHAEIHHHSWAATLETTTSDGSDNYGVGLDAGGGAGATTRGAFWGCYGNESSTHPGSIVGQLGASGDYKFYGGSAADKVFHLNGAGAAGLELSASRFIVGGAYNSTNIYSMTSGPGRFGIFGENAYSSCGTHVEIATDADNGWAPFYVNKFDWTSGDDARWMSFGVNGFNTDVATLNYDGTNFSIVNASDYRLKENIVDYSGGLAKLEELKVRSFNKKEGVSKHITQQGFIAHEAAAANIPGFILGEKDATKTNEAGETVPDYQTVNREALIPYLVSAIQELSAKVKELESK